MTWNMKNQSIYVIHFCYNDLSDPQLQHVLGSMSRQIIGIEYFEVLLDPIQKVTFFKGINKKK
jgi:hypothetical protein